MTTHHIEAEVIHHLLLHIHGGVTGGNRLYGDARVVLPALPLVDAQGLEGVLQPGQVAQPVQVRRDRPTGEDFSSHLDSGERVYQTLKISYKSTNFRP